MSGSDCVTIIFSLALVMSNVWIDREWAAVSKNSGGGVPW